MLGNAYTHIRERTRIVKLASVKLAKFLGRKGIQQEELPRQLRLFRLLTRFKPVNYLLIAYVSGGYGL